MLKLLWSQVGTNGGFAPERKTVGAAGYDLRVPCDVIWDLYDQVTVGLGLAVAVPEGHGGLVRMRSSLGVLGLECLGTEREDPLCPSAFILAGVIDSDYRGELKVVIKNLSRRKLRVARGDRVCQLIIVPTPTFEVEEVSELPASERGVGGFGSTGVR